MRLINVLKLMFMNEATGNINIKLREFSNNNGEGRIFYDGKLKDLVDYIETHDNLNQSDGFPVQVQNIYKWNIVEILVDHQEKKRKNYQIIIKERLL